MNNKIAPFSKAYRTALKAQLQPGAATNVRAALAVGQRAVGLGLETLDVAKVHQQSLDEMGLSGRNNRMIRRAEMFFTESITPIVATHRAARLGRQHINRLSSTLGRRTRELAAVSRQLQRGIVRRKKIELALRKRGEHHIRLLADSETLQQSLRNLTRQVMASQEEKHRKFSATLQDGIAQALVGINIGLYSLKLESERHHTGFRNKIANTQKLALNTVKSIKRSARRFRKK